MKKQLVGCVVVALLAGCETPGGVNVMTVAPASNTGAAQLRDVAVIGFSGQGGEEFTAALESKLAGATFDNRSYFNVVDRQTVRGLTKTRGASAQDVAQVIAFGDSLGVNGVFFGDVINRSVDASSRRETRNECVEWDGIFDCERREERTITCYDLAANFSAIPKLVNVRTGEIVYTANISEKAEETYCEGDKPVSQEELLGRAMNAVLEDIRNAVAPRNMMVKVELIEEATFEVPEHQAQFDGAIAFANEGRFDRACGTFLVLGDLYPEYLPVAFNQAVCAESQGDFEGAFESYAKLDAGLVSPNPTISAALSRVQGQLRSQGMISN